MSIFIVIVSICAVGIGAVFWILKNDRTENDSIVKLEPDHILEEDLAEGPSVSEDLAELKPETHKSKLSFLSRLKFGKKKDKTSGQSPKPKTSSKGLKGILGKLKFGKRKEKDENSKEAEETNESPFSVLKKTLDMNRAAQGEKPQKSSSDVEPMPLIDDPAMEGTGAMTTAPAEEATSVGNLTTEEEKKIDQEVNLSTELDELKEKYEQLDKLFKEKNEELDQCKKTIRDDKTTETDFNKVKDILEKKLKEVKDRGKDLQSTVNSTFAENEGYKKRIEQLEGKVTQSEKTILENEQEIENLKKQTKKTAQPPPGPESSTTETSSQEDSSIQTPQEQTDLSSKGPETTAEPEHPPSQGNFQEEQKNETVNETEIQLESDEAPEPQGNEDEQLTIETDDSPAQPPEKEEPLIVEKDNQEEPAPSEPQPTPTQEEVPSSQPPPEQDEESSGQEPEKETEFLKLQPDVTSQTPDPNTEVQDTPPETEKNNEQEKDKE